MTSVDSSTPTTGLRHEVIGTHENCGGDVYLMIGDHQGFRLCARCSDKGPDAPLKGEVKLVKRKRAT